MYSTTLVPPPPEVAAVLATLAAEPSAGVKLNDISAATGLPRGHVGRHLRTLERDRLARYALGAWHATGRGRRNCALPEAAGESAAA